MEGREVVCGKEKNKGKRERGRGDGIQLFLAKCECRFHQVGWLWGNRLRGDSHLMGTFLRSGRGD